MRRMNPVIVCLVVLTVAVVVSGIAPAERLTWWLEIGPILIVAPILVLTHRRFPLTPLLYVLIAIHGVILAIGGHWTYAEVPLGEWVRDWLGRPRNDYDKLGHLAQGFIPALAMREIFIRTGTLARGRLAAVVIVLSCLGISAGYELIEWLAAISLGQGADQFLGTQGDPWDTQGDMACAGVGAILALLLLSRVHDRQLVAQRARAT
jgi:putative membrane protein